MLKRGNSDRCHNEIFMNNGGIMRKFVKEYYFACVFLIILIFAQWAFSQNVNHDQTDAIKLKEGLYLLSGFACNIVVSIGEDGLLTADTGHQSQAEKIISTIMGISGRPIRVVFNTHFHFDHIGGNEAFAEKGAMIIAQENSRKRMMDEWRVPEILGAKWPTIPPYPEISLPQIDFNESITVHFNDDTIQALHFPDAHSDGDAIIYIRKANVIYTGDLYLSNGFPIIDIYHGGSVNGYIEAVGKIIELCDEDTRIVPGHGEISDREGLRAYHEMLTIARDRIHKLIKAGKTLEEVLAANPTKNLYKGGKSWLSPKLFIYVVYQELSR